MNTNTHLLPGRKAAPEQLGDVLILGLGKSGRAVAEYCCDLIGTRVRSLTIAAGDRNEKVVAFADACRETGARVLFDTFTFDTHFDTCIASPGISQFSRFYENAASVSTEIMSEVEFAWRESRADTSWVAITGTNGKTTTTTLVYHILKTAGLHVAAVGNIGNTCIGAVKDDTADVYVAEVSSFQLASMIDFAPNAAVLLNITLDHIYWHMTLDAYIEAKKQVFANLDKTHGTLVIDAVNDTTRACVRDLKAQADRGFDYIPLGTKDGLHTSMVDACGSDAAAWIKDGMLCVTYKGETVDLIAEADLQIKGEHNASNALAAASAALSMGVDPAKIREGLLTFKPLEHRLEPCGTVAGVQCFNDSKATNVDATLKALESFPLAKPIFLLGGHDKGTDLAELVASAEQHCRCVVCFGAAGQRFMDAFAQSSLVHIQAEHMEDALDAALGMSQAGDIVVLSPACASFDEFDSFEHRGLVFKHLVEFRAATCTQG